MNSLPSFERLFLSLMLKGEDYNLPSRQEEGKEPSKGERYEISSVIVKDVAYSVLFICIM